MTKSKHEMAMIHHVRGATEEIGQQVATLMRSGMSMSRAFKTLGVPQGTWRTWINADKPTKAELTFRRILSDVQAELAQKTEVITRLARERLIERLESEEASEKLITWVLEKTDEDFKPVTNVNVTAETNMKNSTPQELEEELNLLRAENIK